MVSSVLLLEGLSILLWCVILRIVSHCMGVLRVLMRWTMRPSLAFIVVSLSTFFCENYCKTTKVLLGSFHLCCLDGRSPLRRTSIAIHL